MPEPIQSTPPSATVDHHELHVEYGPHGFDPEAQPRQHDGESRRTADRARTARRLVATGLQREVGHEEAERLQREVEHLHEWVECLQREGTCTPGLSASSVK